MADQPNIGFVGIGAMGWHMAGHLAKKGFPVAVYDINQEQQKKFVASHQARGASSLGDVGKGADVVITMLPTGKDVRYALIEGEDGALAKALPKDAIVVDMSSADPAGTRELAGILAKRGITLIDAPVSGGIPGAENARLTIMIGSDNKAAVERVKPVLAAMGQKFYETGASGTGHAMKCLNNFIAGTGYLVAAEALVVGKKFGLDPELMTDILNSSTGRNFSTENYLKQEVISGKFGSGFVLGLLAKDVKCAADLAEDIQAHAPLARLSRDLLARAREVVGPAADHTAAIQYWEKLNATKVSGTKA